MKEQFFIQFEEEGQVTKFAIEKPPGFKKGNGDIVGFIEENSNVMANRNSHYHKLKHFWYAYGFESNIVLWHVTEESTTPYFMALTTMRYSGKSFDSIEATLRPLKYNIR